MKEPVKGRTAKEEGSSESDRVHELKMWGKEKLL